MKQKNCIMKFYIYIYIYTVYKIMQSCNKSKAMWDVIKRETGKRGETIRNYKINYENSTIVDPKEIS